MDHTKGLVMDNKTITLPNFTAQEREDFVKILELMRIRPTVQITFVLHINHKADYDAALYILAEFNRGRRAKT